MNQKSAKSITVLDDRLVAVFGSPSDPIEKIDARAQVAFPGQSPIVWEGDPATFKFSYIGDPAANLLGYPIDRWTMEATFWADIVVHSDDRDGAIAYCALATAQGSDHEFEYRARSVDGQIVWLRDVVRVILGPKRVPVLLRGVMFDITAEKAAAGTSALPPRAPRPTREQLMAG